MNKRIGNDIIVNWSLKNGGEPFLIEGADVSLYLRGGSGTEKLTDFTVSGNLITWIFRGKNQRCTGKHSLILIINEGKDGMITTDACPFVNLVACSNQQGGSDYPNIEIESVEIESELEMVNGQMIVVDSALSLTSPNPVQNAVVTAELEKKVNSSDLATINGKRIDEGGNIEIEGGESSVFEAIYDTTTFEEIVEARNAGKIVICVYNQLIYKLIRLTAERAKFSVTEGNFLYQVICQKGGSWIRDNVNLTHKLETLDNGNAKITIAGNTAEVATPQYVENAIQQSGGGASNEWKCVADRRLLEGEMDVIFTTYADGTPLKAKEVMVQILCDKKSSKNITGYVRIKSTNNQNEAVYGSLMYEDATINEGEQRLNQIHLTASPFFMVAEMRESVKCTVAAPTVARVQGGDLNTFQIYEDIVSVSIQANVALTSAAPYIKIYAR